jgi:insertion element IS1 protein InsB
MPDFETRVLPAQRGDCIECDEMWTFLGTKDCPCWIWLSWSFQTTQTLSFSVGGRDDATGRGMIEAIPSDYTRKPMYTDGYVVYNRLIAFSRHWVCPKGSGQTNIAKRCNTYLRHRVSCLVRRSASFARNIEWLFRRLFYVLFCRNERIAHQGK